MLENQNWIAKTNLHSNLREGMNLFDKDKIAVAGLQEHPWHLNQTKSTELELFLFK